MNRIIARKQCLLDNGFLITIKHIIESDIDTNCMVNVIEEVIKAYKEEQERLADIAENETRKDKKRNGKSI